VVDVTLVVGLYLHIFGQGHRDLGANFLTQVFLELGNNVFRAFDWPSSASGSKVMAKKIQVNNHLS